MQLVLLFLTQAIIRSTAQGFVDIYSYIYGDSLSQFDQHIIQAEQSAASSSVTETPTASSSGNTVQNIVDAITSGDFDVISQAIQGGTSMDVATAFISATGQGATKQNLARFIVQVVQNTQSVSKIAEAFNIMADQAACNTILAIFSEIESFVVDDVILENLLDTFSAQKVLDCVATAAGVSQSSPPPPPPSAAEPAAEPAAAPVPNQNTCLEGGTSCQWWQKQSRSLLNNISQCQQRYVCNFYGFTSISECQRQCQ